MWLTALIMGLAGSLHCLGMCSPLVMAATSLRKPFLFNRLLYNGGRIFTYGLLGVLVSAFGYMFRLSGFQNFLTIAMGTLLIILGLSGVSHVRIPVVGNLFQKIIIHIKTLFSGFLKEKTMLSISLMGMLNGLLPCGLTYLALTYCLTLANPANGFLFMIIFGAGTLPVMLGFTSGVQALITRFNFNFRNFTTITMIALGALLIARTAFVHFHESAIPESENPIVICK